MRARARSRTILFGVTIDYQLRYHDGLEEKLVNDGWDVHLVSGSGPILDRLGQAQGVTAHELAMKRNPSPVADLVALVKWIRLLRRVRPAVVVVATPKAALLGSIAAACTGVPVRIYENLGLRLETAQGLLAKVLLGTERLTNAMSTWMVGVGRSLADRAVELGASSREKTIVIGAGSPNGIDVTSFERASNNESGQRELREQLGIGDDSDILLFVGRITRDKGIDTLGAALALLAEDRELHLLVVGRVDDEDGDALVDRLSSSAWNTTFIGEVEDVAPYFSISDVFCFPSRREGLGLVILESFASRVPVVATRATGVVELVINDRTGALVEHDPQQFADAVARALDDKGWRCSVADQAYRLVHDSYRREVVQANWLAFLDEQV